MKGKIDIQKVDLDYDLDDFFQGPYLPDSDYYVWRVNSATVEEANAPGPGRVLDVACGTGASVVWPLEQRGWQAWGLDASLNMLRLGRDQARERGGVANLVRGIAECLPFPDNTFDCLVCKGSLDHFANPEVFMAEARRVLRPQGRLVIALANYRSLSCQLGRLLWPLLTLLARRLTKGRPYWAPPPDHTFRGDMPTLLGLGRQQFRLLRCYGVSLLWLFPRWGWLLQALPPRVARGLLDAGDRLARLIPHLGDVIVTVWVKDEDQG